MVDTLLGDASDLILRAVSGSDAEWITDEKVGVPRSVIFTCVAAVRREFQAGDGIAREQLGEYSISYRANGPTNLELTPNERRVVRSAAGLSSAKSVALESPFTETRAPVDMDFSFPLEVDEGVS
ncbi:MAG TPA: hypothetical protein VD761_07810 [Solirubrobacterales bacterium]|nr:hypothetical protein [Solirubrobacterales bacterium]